MGSRITSQARASRPRRLVDGSSLAPSIRRRSAASWSVSPPTAPRSMSGSTQLSLSQSRLSRIPLAATFGLFEIEVWWELVSLITIMVLGHWLEMRAISQARGALNTLAALLPDTAERVRGIEIEIIPLSELKPGDIFLIRPGGAAFPPTERSFRVRLMLTSR